MNRSYNSPNFDQRRGGHRVQFIVIHYTGMATAAEALARLCDPEAGVSAHYMVDEGGQVFALVDEGHRAWHAGTSFWRGISDINSASIGIELANPGDDPVQGWQPFPEAQIVALIDLLQDIMKRHNLAANAVLGHADVTPDRKADPGGLFPWQRLSAYGLGRWPQPLASDYAAPTGADEIAALLQTIGYGPYADLQRPAFLQSVLAVFKTRYCQDGTADDREVLARLRALAGVVHSE